MNIDVEKLLTEATTKFAEVNGYTAKHTRSSKKPRRVREIEQFIQSQEFGCKREVVAGLVSLVIGTSLHVGTRARGSLVAVQGAVVVPTGNPNGHNYPLHKPCVLTESGFDCAIRVDGTMGNNLPSIDEQRDCLRPATTKEIAVMVGIVGKRLLSLLA